MYSLVLVSLAAMAVCIVNAQDLSALPSCARDAATAGFAQTGCGLTDIKCICNASAFLKSIQPLIEQKCSQDEQQATVAFAVELCQNAGVVLPSAVESPTASAVSTEAEASSSSGNAEFTVLAITSTSNVNAPSSVSNSVPSSDLSTSPSATSPSASSASSASSSSSSSYASSTSSASSSTPSTSSPLIPTIPASSKNSTSNTTVATSKPIPFKGDATGTTSQSWLGLCVAIAGAAMVGWAL